MEMKHRCMIAAFGLLVVVQALCLPSVIAERAPVTIDWFSDTTISDAQSYDSVTINLYGDLIIQGSLDLSSSTLVVYSKTSGEHRIVVEDGGSFTVLASSVIQAGDPSARYLFQVRPEGALVMNNSQLRDCGWDDVENWIINPNTDRGLYIESSNVSITNNTIFSCGVGLIVVNGSAPAICNNTIAKNDASGIEVYGGASPLIDGNLICRNMVNNINFNAGGIFSDTSNPVITNNTVSDNTDALYGCTYGILTAGGGNSLVSKNNITGHVDPNGYGWGCGLITSDVGGVSFNNISDNDNGVYLLGNSVLFENNLVLGNDEPAGGIGLYDNSISTCRNNTYSANLIGIIAGEGAQSTFDNETIDNNTDCGINGASQIQQFQGTFSDCTFRDNTYDVALTDPWSLRGGGSVYLVRPDYNATRVVVTDDSAKLFVKWDLDVLVAMESDLSPVAGAPVTVAPSGSGEPEAALTGPDGRTETFLLEEYRIDRLQKASQSPYTVSVKVGQRTSSLEVTLDRSQDVTLVMDDVAPHLNITSPANGTLTSKSRIELTGFSEPAATLTVDDRAVTVQTDGEWAATVDLTNEGLNEFTVEASDPQGNKAHAHLVIFRDSTAPAIEVESPKEDFLVNTTSITVSGMISEPQAALTLNGINVTVGKDGRFSCVYDLTERENTILLVCTDAAGNVGSVEISGTRDTKAPFLDVREPANGCRTNASAVSAFGIIDLDAALTINGASISFTGTSFRVPLSLREGENVFEFAARDYAGNVNTTSIRVFRDSTPPALSVSAPADGARLSKSTVLVQATTEPGAAISINGKSVANVNGTVSAEVQLPLEGSNKIVIECSDELGNRASRTITVVRDTVPPPLAIVSPPNKSLTNRTAISITGTTEPGATVSIGGRTVKADAAGLFAIDANLSTEGANDILLSSADDLLNTATASMTIFRDTRIEYNITGPGEGTNTTADTIAVTGKAEKNAKVFVNGAPVPCLQDGTFNATVPLTMGANAITVQITDPAGNSVYRTLSVTRTAPVKPKPQTENPMASGLVIGIALALTLGGVACAVVGYTLSRRRKN